MKIVFSARFLTKPMDEEWQARLRETQGDIFERSPAAKQLKEKLLSIGGGEVLLHQVAPSDIDRLLTRGELWSGRKDRMQRMQHNRCHENSVRLWEGKKGDLVNGFALSRDGLWREHTWIVNGDMVIETTEPRAAYYGARLTEEEIRREYDPDFFCHQVYGSLSKVAILPERPGLVGPVYHGTIHAFDTFELPENRGIDHELGIHFGTIEQAETAAKEIGNTNIHPVYLRIKNPVKLDDHNNWSADDVALDLWRAQVIDEETYDWLMNEYMPDPHVNQLECTKMFRKLIEDAGYDSVIYDNEFEGLGYSYIIWHPEQIVPAFVSRQSSLSKVADLPKRPGLVGPLFHGTSEVFDKFMLPEDITDHGGLGVHFGNAQQANTMLDFIEHDRERWTEDEEEYPQGKPEYNIHPVYLRVKNPLRLPDLVEWYPREVGKQLYRRKVITAETWAAFLDSSWKSPPAGPTHTQAYAMIRKWIEDAGFDSVVYKNKFEGSGDSYIVWHLGQIVPAFKGHRRSSLAKIAAVIWNNGWITPKGRWKALEDGETHASALPERLRVLWNEWAGGDNQAIKEGWIRVIIEESYWDHNKTGKKMADFNFQTYDTNTRQRLRRAILNLDPEIEMVGLDCEEIPGFETLTAEEALKRVG